MSYLFHGRRISKFEKNMKQLFEVKKMVGKTVKKTCWGYNERELWIRFTDDTFIVIRSTSRSEGFGHSYDVIEIDDIPADNTDHSLVNLGLITKSEYNYAIEERDKKYELEKLKQQEEQEEHNREEELLLLKKLKEKYEG